MCGNRYAKALFGLEAFEFAGLQVGVNAPQLANQCPKQVRILYAGINGMRRYTPKIIEPKVESLELACYPL
jgi:hypothetical protein